MARERPLAPAIVETWLMEALAGAHDLARWNKGAEIIYTFDGSTWGNA